jgi:hypothetical protein
MIWFLAALFPVLAFAKPPCEHNAFAREFANMVHPAAVVDTPDRRTDQQYADKHTGGNVQAVRDRYAATGDFDCPGNLGQASLTVEGRGDIITTAAHNFYKGRTCNKRTEDFSKCTFTVVWKGKTITAHPKNIVKSGFHCPNGPFEPSDDWLVLQLDNEIKGPKPYRVDDSRHLRPNQPVTAVGKSADFQVKVNGEPTMVKHYADCAVGEDVWGGSRPDYVNTTCDGSHRNSGGSLLSKDDDPALLGIAQSGVTTESGAPGETAQQALQAGRNFALGKGPLTAAPYSKSWATGYIPIEGELLKTLQDLKPVDL